MKNTKFAKIVTLVLSAVLLIGCAVAISVSAAESAPSVEIAHKNLAYEGAIKVLYAVDAQNYDAETQSVVIRFTVGGETYDKPLTEDYIEFDDGSKYNIVYSKGIAPKNMRQTITATPLIINNDDGETVVAGESVEYSVYQYAMNRFSKDPTVEQKTLYVALLDYGTGVQKTLMDSGLYTAEELEAVGGYANEYYALQIDNYVDGVLADSDIATFNEYDAKLVGAIEVDKNHSGAIFGGFTDANGNKIADAGKTSETWNKLSTAGILSDIGTAIINANYKTKENGATFVTYDGATMADNFISPQSSAPEEESILSATYEYVDPADETNKSTYTVKYVKEGKVTLVDGTLLHSKHARIVEIIDVASGESIDETPCGEYYVGRKIPQSKSNAAGIEALYGNATEIAGQGTTYLVTQTLEDLNAAYNKPVYRHVFETDFYLPEANGTVQGWFITSTDHKLWGLNMKVSGSSIDLYMQGDSNATNCVDHGKTIKGGLDKNEWHNLRLEYYDLPNDTMAVYVYIDGELCPSSYGDAWTHYWNEKTESYIASNKKDAYVKAFNMNFLKACTQVDLYYDNTYMATEYVEGGLLGAGLYANNADTENFDFTEELTAAGKTWDDVHSLNQATLGFTINEIFGQSLTSNAYTRFAEENGNYYLTTKTAGVYKSGSFTKSFADEAKTGDRYIVEFDVRFFGHPEADTLKSTTSDNSFGWLRIYDSNTSSADGDRILSLTILHDETNPDYWTFAGKKVALGEWANIRVIMTPDAESTTKTAYEVYVNNSLVLSTTTTSYKGDNTTFGRAVFQARNYHDYYAFDLDNFYMGVESDTEE